MSAPRAGGSAFLRVIMSVVLPVTVLVIHLAPIAFAMQLAAWPVLPPAAAGAVGGLAYAVGLPVLAGALSVIGHGAMRPGRLPRDLGHPTYARRRFYGACWTSLYYHVPLYALVLAVPPLRAVVLRLFGYRGDLGFTIYPDVWIRDWPLVDIGRGAYLANRATISPNLALADGTLKAAPVRIGDGVMIGHGTLIAPGVTVGSHAVIGTGARVSFGVTVGPDARVGDVVNVDHHVVVGRGAAIGNASALLGRCLVDEYAQIIAGTVVLGALARPPRAGVSE